MIKTTEETQELVAQRIFNYYKKIIEIKKNKGLKLFVIDKILQETRVSLVHLTDKYDGSSTWKESIDITENDDLYTASGSFREAFEPLGPFYVDIEEVLRKVSVMLSKQGIANYFSVPLKIDQPYSYFSELLDKQWLYIVL